MAAKGNRKPDRKGRKPKSKSILNSTGGYNPPDSFPEDVPPEVREAAVYLDVPKRAFAEHYVFGRIGVRNIANQAWVAAGLEIPAGKGSFTAAVVTMLNNPLVNGYIQALHDWRRSRMVLTDEMIVREFARIAFIDLGPMLRMGTVVRKNQVRFEGDWESLIGGVIDTAAMKSIKPDGQGGVIVEFYDKTRALENLARIRNLYDADNRSKLGDALSALMDEIDSKGPGFRERIEGQTIEGKAETIED